MLSKIQNRGEVTVIHFKGALNLESAQKFKQVCEQYLIGKKIIFNMSDANFVGSTGIQSFLEAVTYLSSGTGLKIAGPKSEFRRILAHLESPQLQIFETEESALASF
ncbi:MAG: STAS domain-containing protein [Proteobacteria bacterium]|jgi:anti-anti-sigma factor|nr:STAS domain-containing protein [Pseudomonadota bacterium]